MAGSESSFTRADLVNQELAQELARKASLEARGITIITASGILVTLAFGFSAAVAKGHHFGTFTFPEKTLLGVSLGFFIFSSVFGLLTNTPRNYGLLKAETLQRSGRRPPQRPRGGQWKSHASRPLSFNYGTPDEPITEETLEELIIELEAARKADDNKASALLISMSLQLAAVAILGATVVLVVI